MTVYDKRAAIYNGSEQHKRKKRRVPESTLLLVGALGAALPMFITMKSIRHKTKHKKFMIGLPFFCLLHLALLFHYAYGTMLL